MCIMIFQQKQTVGSLLYVEYVERVCHTPGNCYPCSTMTSLLVGDIRSE